MAHLLFKLFLVLFSLNAIVASEYKHRTKRKVLFSKSSKFFFRFNGKDNMFNYTQIFAHGWSMRINYDLPETIPKRHQFFKRDVHAELSSISDEAVPNVYSCILKYICENVQTVQRAGHCGIFCGIGNIIASSTTAEADFFRNFIRNCDFHSTNCLLDLTE